MKPILEKNRLEAFSDGVIAIIITLLILEIKVPHVHGDISSAALWHSLGTVLPKLFSWAMSFVMVLIMWVNHHRIFNDVRHSDNGLMWWNGLLLFAISFVPFPTAFLGDYFGQPVSMAFFGLCLSVMGLSFYLLRLHISRNPELLHERVDRVLYRTLLRRSLLSPILYSAGAALAFINIFISLAIYVGLPIYFIFYGSPKKE